MIFSKTDKNHYTWGDNCDAWTLMQSDNIIIKEEKMPPNTEERLHFHNEVEQVFYIINGKASFLIEEKEYLVSKNEGIKVHSKASHKISNKGSEELHFLVISLPGYPNDRVNVE